MLKKIRNKLHRKSREDAEIAQKSVEAPTEQPKTTAAATTTATPSEELRSSKDSIHEEHKPTETTQEMNTQRSDFASSATTASSGAGVSTAGLSSGQAPLSSAGLATRTSAGTEAGAVGFPSGSRDEVFIREEKKLPTSLPPHDIELEKIQKDLAAEKVALMNKINQSKAAIANAEKDLMDHHELITRNEQTINTCRANAAEFMRLENVKEEAKRAALEEERRLETLRAKKHDEAVMLENERADFKAKRIASEQQEQQARQLIEYHKESLSHSNKYITAHKTLIDSLNSQLSVLDQTVDIHVLGERARVGEQTIGVTVEVKPEVLPEARVISTVLPTVKAAGAAIEEHSVPGPEFVPVNLKAEQVAHTAEKVERLRIEE